MSYVTRKFRIFTLFIFSTILPSIWFTLPKLVRTSPEDFKTRTKRQGKIENLDSSKQLIPSNRPVCT
ncbi:hypothetical protein F4823DRAFT_610717 [Ustulina deusta]|nr:hypothetical protein F4823DRAFT_610717 [Ustulina deusta]